MAPTRKAYATADEQQRLLLQFLIGNSLVWGKNINPLSGDNSYNIPLENWTPHLSLETKQMVYVIIDLLSSLKLAILAVAISCHVHFKQNRKWSYNKI